MDEFDFETWAGEALVRIQSGIHLRRPSDYQSLFKYIGLDSDISWHFLHKTLHNAELVGSAASRLNDPFELSPYVFDDLRSSTIAEAVHHIDQYHLEGRQPKPLSEVFPNPEPFRKQARLYLQEVLDGYRVISFCERIDSSLLWSHYANSYQGACLHFLAQGFRWHSFYTLGHVSYSKYRPAYPLSLALALSSKPGQPGIPVNATPLRRAESDKILFFTKADDWAYEAEMRLVYDQKRHPVVRFKKESLVSIITGPRFTDENRQRLDSILKGSPYENDIAIRKARLSETTFTVEISE